METWIREKLPRVSSDDYGRDETSAQSLLRKHETLELELDSYRAKVSDLKSACHALVTAGNFDKEKILRRQVRDTQVILCHNIAIDISLHD